ncbi:hypothetical protein PR003_g3902 [Phytophthora rubi]|uniref:Uncharacterized protein n=1 Tax=Phytophthora rubi TaxID=129364 RepID=A0A6A4G325_9STRA|nr:hypothetical protein PR003_g3902 [Phytophthora rubi]
MPVLEPRARYGGIRGQEEAHALRRYARNCLEFQGGDSVQGFEELPYAQSSCDSAGWGRLAGN